MALECTTTASNLTNRVYTNLNKSRGAAPQLKLTDFSCGQFPEGHPASYIIRLHIGNFPANSIVHNILTKKPNKNSLAET